MEHKSWWLLLAGAVCSVGQQSAYDFIEGLAIDTVLLTMVDGSSAKIRAFNTRTYTMRTPFAYGLADLVALGVSPTLEGRNRSVLPSGIVLHEATGFGADTIYWTDAGAGVILGLRFDSSNMRIVAQNLLRPEHVALDASADAIADGGAILYWGDSAANMIQRCRLRAGGSGAAVCNGAPTVVLHGVQLMGGLTYHAGRIYWADMVAGCVRSALIDAVGRVIVSSVAQIVAGVAIPIAIAIERTSAHLYVLDQLRPATLGRADVGANMTELKPVLSFGLSRPCAFVFAEAQRRTLLIDSGTMQILSFATADVQPTPTVIFRRASGFEPRGAAARRDISVFVAPPRQWSTSDAEQRHQKRAAGAVEGLGVAGLSTLLLLWSPHMFRLWQ